MKKIAFTLVAFGFFLGAGAQDNETLGQHIDELTYRWDEESKALNNYDGLSEFCLSVEYRSKIIILLNDIHHYDSVLFDRLSKAARFSKDHEIEKTLKEIEKFEGKYDMRSFLHFLHEECDRRKEIEHNAKELKNDIGANSYDGQIYIIETELNKYIKHITKRMDHIRKHVHHLHVK